MWLGATTDPTALIPGSPADIDAAVISWNQRARTADEASASLRGLATLEGWSGTAATAYESRVAKTAKPWALLNEAFSAAATALQEYGATLAWAQTQAELAIETWEKGHREQAAALLLPVDAPTPANPGGGLKAEAQEILAHARTELAAAGDRAAAVIRAATAQPDLRDSTWAGMGRVVATPADALAFISGLTGSELDAVLDARPDVSALLAKAEPANVAAWWDTLRTGQQIALIGSLPAIIGNLEGVAYGARDRANGDALEDRLEQAKAALARAERPMPWFPPPSEGQALAHALRAAEAREQLEALQSIDVALNAPDGGAPRYLVSLSQDSPPLAAVSIGDLDLADNVTYAVPGMGSSAAGMQGWASSAENLHTAQSFADPNRQHAVVAWIGYEAPPIPVSQGGFDVLGTEDAAAGAVKLNATLEGFHATRTDASLNVVAHSYGTTTSAIALSTSDVRVESFVSVGSAGLPPNIDQATDLNADEVFAGQATDVAPIIGGDGDQWAWTGRLGSDHPVNPVLPEFGAQPFGTDTGAGGLTSVDDHATSTPDGTGYLDANTESLLNIAYSTTDQGDLVSSYVPTR